MRPAESKEKEKKKKKQSSLQTNFQNNKPKAMPCNERNRREKRQCPLMTTTTSGFTVNGENYKR